MSEKNNNGSGGSKQSPQPRSNDGNTSSRETFSQKGEIRGNVPRMENPPSPPPKKK